MIRRHEIGYKVDNTERISQTIFLEVFLANRENIKNDIKSFWKLNRLGVYTHTIQPIFMSLDGILEPSKNSANVYLFTIPAKTPRMKKEDIENYLNGLMIEGEGSIVTA